VGGLELAARFTRPAFDLLNHSTGEKRAVLARLVQDMEWRCALFNEAASTARACSRVALKCNAARLSANTFKLTPHMSLCL